MECLKKFEVVAPALSAGLENLNKWYRKTDDTDAYFICLGTVLFVLTLSILTKLASFGPERQVGLCRGQVG
jgi:hypothetical protein